jgi:hypothetical protein
MKPIFIFTLDNMIRANAEFWEKATARFKARISERPGDVRRALDATAKQFERDCLSGTEIDAVRKQRSLEDKIFELEKIEAGQTSERNSSIARLSRPRRPELETKIDEILTRNPNVKARVAWHEVKKLPEAKGLSSSAFASLLSRRKKDFQ